MRNSNLVVNLNKVRAANQTKRVQDAVFIFDYFAPESAQGEINQTPLVRVIGGSLKPIEGSSGDWMFKGVNLYRVGEDGTGLDGAIRTFRMSRINGLLRRP